MTAPAWGRIMEFYSGLRMDSPSGKALGLRTPTLRWQVLCAGICALLLTIGISRFAYTPLLPIMRNEAGLSYLAGGWLATFNYVGYIAGALLAATTAKLSAKYLYYRVGLVLGVLSTLGMAMTTDPVIWSALRFLGGLSSTAGMLLASGLVLNWLMRHQHKPELGLHFAGVGLGIMLSGAAVALMAPFLAWDEQWWAFGLLAALIFLPAWFWMPVPQALSTQAQAMSLKPPSDRTMNLMVATYFCAGFGYVLSATFIVAILEKLPLLTGRGSWVWVIVGLAAAPSSFAWDRIARNTGVVGALIIAYLLQIVSIVLPVLTEHAGLNILSAVLFGGTFVGIVSLTLTQVGRFFPANPAKAMAKLTLSYGVAQIAAPAMAGYIAAASGSYSGSLEVATVVMLLGTGLLIPLYLDERAHRAT
ncbi:MAG: YbfB/YjiJ family MFS transporter [Limnobacter sp.]|uniref:YbfB/YjiJ family MFS transporter n=1 Tax=Limnobacter sp. TaxID=2003368 RepID=UPI003919342C